jgi:glycosyltransferase involved in cell wall biosynthesis
MKIGLVIYGSLDTMSGGFLYDRKLVEFLQSQGDSVELISLPWRNYLAHLTDNVTFRLPPKLDILIQDELNHPSLLVANTQRSTYPVISLVHNLHSSEQRPAWQNAIYRKIEKLYLNSVDGFIFNSDATHNAVNTLIKDAKPYIIATPGGNRLGTVTSERIRARATEPGPLRLLFLANVTSLKGLHVLLEALKLQSSDFRLDVIGSLDVDREYARKMQQLSRGPGFKSGVFFHGILDGDALIEKLRQSHVLVIPSFYEGFGIAYLEGMAFGLPAIGTTAGAIPQLITDGESGYLIAPGDYAALAQRLQQLASNRELLTRLSLNARRRFDEFPTWEQTAEAIRKYLLQMIDGKIKIPI